MEEVILETNHPIAQDSLDHLFPFGTAVSYPTNQRFIDKWLRLYLNRAITDLTVLDLGCGGGTFVQALIDRGVLGIGLEGSDYSKKRKRAAWKFYSDQFLFTCDITKPFDLLMSEKERKQPLFFDAITAWEVMEHIPEEKVSTVIENIKQHLKPSGLVILSISDQDSIYMGKQLHVCKHPESWWIQKFEKGGLYHLPEYKKYFNGQYIAGPKIDKTGFNLILSMDPKNCLKPPKISLKERIMDRWIGSKTHYKLSKVIG